MRVIRTLGWNVKGILFADYVRMIRSCKGVDWTQELQPDDLSYLRAHVDFKAWYPMATFERMGNAILKHIALGDLNAVRMCGASRSRCTCAAERRRGAMLFAGQPSWRQISRHVGAWERFRC
jgi:hypothetical protein